MGRKKVFEDIKKDVYNSCYKALDEVRETEDCYILRPRLASLTGYKESQISKALQWGRRQFEEGKLRIDQWIMGGPKGYFLPKRGYDERIYAYAIQNIKDIRSRARTQLPLYEALLRDDPDALREAYLKSTDGREDISTEMNPWAVFNKIIESDYIHDPDEYYF